MTFGEQGKEGLPSRHRPYRADLIYTDTYLCGLGARVHELKDVNAILDGFQKHGHYEVR